MSWRIPLVIAAVAFAVLWSTKPNSPRITEVADRPVAIATLPCVTSVQKTSSGFVIDDELVLTVAHAIFESRDFAVRDASGKWHDAFVLAMDLERDLALVQVEGLRAAPLSTARVEPDDVVRMIDGASSGTAGGRIRRPVRIKTEVVGDLSQESTRSGYEVALEIAAGDSGAGIVDEAGSLVAVVFARSTSREFTTWVTAMSEVEPLRNSYDVPTWDCGKGSGRDLVLPPLEAEDLAS